VNILKTLQVTSVFLFYFFTYSYKRKGKGKENLSTSLDVVTGLLTNSILEIKLTTQIKGFLVNEVWSVMVSKIKHETSNTGKLLLVAVGSVTDSPALCLNQNLFWCIYSHTIYIYIYIYSETYQLESN
jgi:hypothetical protein